MLAPGKGKDIEAERERLLKPHPGKRKATHLLRMGREGVLRRGGEKFRRILEGERRKKTKKGKTLVEKPGGSSARVEISLVI